MLDVIVNPSRLASLADCPRRVIGLRNEGYLVEAGYELNPEVESIAAFFGNCAHEAAALPPPERHRWLTEQGDNTLDAAWKDKWARVEKSGAIWEWDDKTPDLAAAANQIGKVCNAIDQATSGAFWSERDRWLVEQSGRKSIGDLVGYPFDEWGFDVVLSGRYDFYDKQNKHLVDIKTGGGYAPGDYGIQLATYRALLRSQGETPSNKAHIIFAQRHKYTRTTPEQKPCIVQEYDLRPYSLQAVRAIREQVRHTITFWNDGDVDPNLVACNPKSNLCSEKFCRLHGTDACDITHKGVKQNIGAKLPTGEKK